MCSPLLPFYSLLPLTEHQRTPPPPTLSKYKFKAASITTKPQRKTKTRGGEDYTHDVLWQKFTHDIQQSSDIATADDTTKTNVMVEDLHSGSVSGLQQCKITDLGITFHEQISPSATIYRTLILIPI